MGFSTSGSMVVLLIAVLISFSTLYPAMEQYRESTTDSIETRYDEHIDAKNTEINMTQATYYSGNDTVVLATENIGTEELSIEKVDVLLNGQYQQNYSSTVAGVAERDTWSTGTDLKISISNITTAPDRTKIVVGNGVSDARVVV